MDALLQVLLPSPLPFRCFLPDPAPVPPTDSRKLPRLHTCSHHHSEALRERGVIYGEYRHLAGDMQPYLSQGRLPHLPLLHRLGIRQFINNWMPPSILLKVALAAGQV